MYRLHSTVSAIVLNPSCRTVNFPALLTPRHLRLPYLRRSHLRQSQFHLSPIPLHSMVFIFFNELHYDNVGTDTAQAFEVAGVAGASLDGYTAVLYDGNSGGVYDTLPLTGTIPNEHVGYGALSFNISLQNGPDGIALVNASGHVLEFLSYEGSFEAVSGAASGMVSTDVGVVETASTAAGTSMQLTGSAHSPAGFTWVAGVPASPGALNAGQSFAQSPPPPPSQPPFNSAACPPRSTVRAALLGHTVLPYTSSQTDVWDALKVLDADPNDAANVTLFYSRMSVDGAQEYNSGRGWTREHIWPQSLGQFDAHANEAPATDLFALRPAKPRCNSMRNNFKYGMVSTVSVDSECLLACDTVVQGGDRLCEPVDEIKGMLPSSASFCHNTWSSVDGQIARSLFYMDIAYDAFDDTGATGVNASWADLQLSIVGSPDMFVDWHERFPVTDAERTRNDLIASNYQMNSNPFIVTPGLARCFFGNLSAPALPSAPLPVVPPRPPTHPLSPPPTLPRSPPCCPPPTATPALPPTTVPPPVPPSLPHPTSNSPPQSQSPYLPPPTATSPPPPLSPSLPTPLSPSLPPSTTISPPSVSPPDPASPSAHVPPPSTVSSSPNFPPPAAVPPPAFPLNPPILALPPLSPSSPSGPPTSPSQPPPPPKPPQFPAPPVSPASSEGLMAFLTSTRGAIVTLGVGATAIVLMTCLTCISCRAHHKRPVRPAASTDAQKEVHRSTWHTSQL